MVGFTSSDNLLNFILGKLNPMIDLGTGVPDGRRTLSKRKVIKI